MGQKGQKTKNSHIGSKFLESVCQIQSSEKNIVSNFILQNKGNLDETKKYFECYICNNKLTKRYLLNRHIVSVHEGIKPVECKICCAKLSSKKYLDHHIASVHNGKRPFKCNIYNVKFASRKKKKFKEARQGTTPFECTTCDAKFAVKGYSKRNIKSVHEGMKKTKYGAK